MIWSWSTARCSYRLRRCASTWRRTWATFPNARLGLAVATLTQRLSIYLTSKRRRSSARAPRSKSRGRASYSTRPRWRVCWAGLGRVVAKLPPLTTPQRLSSGATWSSQSSMESPRKVREKSLTTLFSSWMSCCKAGARLWTCSGLGYWSTLWPRVPTTSTFNWLWPGSTTLTGSRSNTSRL